MSFPFPFETISGCISGNINPHVSRVPGLCKQLGDRPKGVVEIGNWRVQTLPKDVQCTCKNKPTKKPRCWPNKTLLPPDFNASCINMPIRALTAYLLIAMAASWNTQSALCFSSFVPDGKSSLFSLLECLSFKTHIGYYYLFCETVLVSQGRCLFWPNIACSDLCYCPYYIAL